MDEEILNGKLHFLCSGKDVGGKWRNLQDLTKHLNDEYFINRPNIIRIVISILVFRIYLLLQNLATRYKKIYPCYHLNTLMKSFVVISSNIHLTYITCVFCAFQSTTGPNINVKEVSSKNLAAGMLDKNVQDTV